jgi:predicted secreted protein
VSIESRLTEILIALDQCDPANLRRHEELEQQILLAKQQICDVSREGKLMLETASKAQQEAITVKSESLLVNKQREKIRPNIESLQSRINEEEDRLKQARVKSFDPKAFSKKLQIEGILAKRRQDKMMRRMVTANRPNLDLEAMVAEHPMSKLVVLGLSDPQDIAAKFQQGKEKALDLQQEQESVESRLKEKQAELNRLHIQLNQMDLANSCAKSPSPVMATDPKSSENIELLQRQNQLAVMTKLTTNVKHYLLALREKVQSIEQQHDSFRDFIDTRDESNMDSNTNRVITLVKELCDDFLHSQKLATKSSPAMFANIRILAKDESESRFTDYASAEVVLLL